MCDEGLVEGHLDFLFDLLDDKRLIVLHMHQKIELLLDCLQMPVHLSRVVANASPIGIHVSRQCDHVKLREPVQGCFDSDLQAGLKRRKQVLIVHVNDRKVNTFNKSFLLDDHVPLNDPIKCHQDDHVSV